MIYDTPLILTELYLDSIVAHYIMISIFMKATLLFSCIFLLLCYDKLNGVAMKREYIQIQITTPTKEDSERLTTCLLEAHLVASVQIIPTLISTYRWNGEIRTKEESLLLLHTTTQHIDAIYDIVCREHPYIIPEYIVLPIIQGSKDYLSWITENVYSSSHSDNDY